jgi:MFS family permease
MTRNGQSSARGGRRDPAFWLLCAAIFLDACGVGVLFPLLARIQAAHHLPDYALGLMSGASFFAALVAQFGISRFLDGARARRVLLGGMLLGAVALVWFARSADLWQLVAARAVGGIGFGVVSPASLREASSGVTGDRRGARIGMISSAMMLGIVVGPLAGSLLAAAGGLALPFEVVAALLLANVAAFALVRHRPAGLPDAGTADASAARRDRRLPWRPVVAVLLVGVAAQLPNGLYDALWSRLLTDRGASSVFIGFSLSIFGLPFVLLAPFGGKIAERRGPLLAAAVTLLAADCFMASYGLVPSPVVIALLGVGEACFQAVAVPGGYAAVARIFPDARAAEGQGWFSGAGTGAAGVAAVAGAPLYAALGPGAVFAGGAAISAVIVVAGLAIAGRRTLTAGPEAATATSGGGAAPGAAVPVAGAGISTP